MTKAYCKVTVIHYTKKEGTKTVYTETDRYNSDFTETQYNNCINASPFFRRLGGSERQEKSYTKRGYKVTKITSISPDRNNKTVRLFNLDI